MELIYESHVGMLQEMFPDYAFSKRTPDQGNDYPAVREGGRGREGGDEET